MYEQLKTIKKDTWKARDYFVVKSFVQAVVETKTRRFFAPQERTSASIVSPLPTANVALTLMANQHLRERGDDEDEKCKTHQQLGW